MEVAVITGGSRGIGKSTALHLARNGIGIVLTYNQGAEAGEAVVEEIRALGGVAVALKLDLGDSASFGGFAGRVGQVLAATWKRANFDFLVNNAGIAQRMSIADTTETAFDQILSVNLKGPFFLTKALLPLMVDGGHVINISSALSRVTFPGTAVYAAGKAALETLTRCFAKEYAHRKIRVNAVAPGAIDTEFGGGKGDAQARRRIEEFTALGRLGEADDIGAFVAAMLSAQGRFLNAERVEVSGGIAI